MSTLRGRASPDLILNAAVLGVGMHPGAWRLRREPPATAFTPAYFRRIGELAEAACLHAVFLADTLSVDEENYERPNLGAVDPLLALTLIAGATEHVGLVATASTTFSEPFGLARRFASLDHLSGGRAAWNVVTTFVPAVAANFGSAPLPAPADRYRRAEEFVDVVQALWRSWQADALIGDQESGHYAEATRVKRLNHHGEFFDVAGPLTLPPSPQGEPVLFQAGSSEAGRGLAARTADAVFTAQNTLVAAQAFRRDMRSRVAAAGRDPDRFKVLPGLLAVLGGTEAEARARKARLDELAGDAERRKLALRLGVPVELLQLDAPLPVDAVLANPAFKGAEGFRQAALELGVREGLTVREILYRNGGGHVQVVGTPEQVADHIAHWHREGAVDGFNLMIDVLPDGLEDLVEQVVPLLQRRGLFRDEYAGRTLRANLGLHSQP
ncbi:LLM class flavin-dependent oxidoreductase [Chitinasiproducens palmae]|uniref:FMN-dependent oxidoreductase, nitrilotriacetate monooxygenase family n=1 Tax=Chitinasiproducens palmae TaxID=1770053 RepID=A0A1H2PQ44_9BURK|nr:LLM class flavin-dependent oxidoreductase [Chitinasiproducens palmae]SDV48942.1 FMN-dependent oxidoreductase, nitrilotriacetate monooxygenase family [Chitinasiproducens palmae]